MVFSPPDSTGRQYPAEITLLQGNKHRTLTDTINKTNNLAVELTRQQATVSSLSSKNQYQQSSSAKVWILTAILLVGGGVCAGKLLKEKRIRN